jgi:hypothetical protein
MKRYNRVSPGITEWPVFMYLSRRLEIIIEKKKRESHLKCGNDLGALFSLAPV